MLAGRIADELIDPAQIFTGNSDKFAGICHADQETTALAV